MLLYSASEDDLDMVGCLLDFHEISAPPKKTLKPVMGILIYELVAQSVSMKP